MEAMGNEQRPAMNHYCEECRNLLPNPAPMMLYKRATDGKRVYGVVLYFCSWHCVEAAAAKAKDYLFDGRLDG